MAFFDPVGAPSTEPSMWNKFSDWINNPSNQQGLLAFGGAIGGEGSTAERISNAMMPRVQGAIAEKAAKEKKAEQLKLSELLSGDLSQVAGNPNVTGVSVKPDGSYTAKFTAPKDLADAEVIRAQMQAGQVQPQAPTQGQPNEVSQLPQGPPMAYEAGAPGNEMPAGVPYSPRFSQALETYNRNPSPSLSGASGLGLSPEQLATVERTAREAVSTPYENAFRAANTAKVAEEARQLKAQGLVPWPVEMPDGSTKVISFTPKEYIAYHNVGMDYLASMAQAKALEGVRSAQVQSNLAGAEATRMLGEERRQKTADLARRRSIIEGKKGQKVPGTDYTYEEADSLGILDDLIKQNAAVAAATGKQGETRKQKVFEAWRKRSDLYAADPTFAVRNKGKTPGQKALEDIETEFPGARTDLEEYVGATRPKAGETIQTGKPLSATGSIPVLPPGSHYLGVDKKTGKKVYADPSGQLYRE